MPLPVELREAVRTRRFWVDYFGLGRAEEREPSAGEAPLVVLPVTERERLWLRVGLDGLQARLELAEPDAAPLELAWSHHQQPAPPLLRWEEVERLASAAAARDQALPAPVVVLLLARFTATTSEAEAATAWALLGRCFDELRLLSAEERARVFDRLDRREAGLRWEQTPEGPVLRQPPGAQRATRRGREGDPLLLRRLAALLGQLPPVAPPSPGDGPPSPVRAVDLGLLHPLVPRASMPVVQGFLDRALRRHAGGCVRLRAMVLAQGTELRATARVSLAELTGRLAALLESCGALPAARVGGLPLPAPAAPEALYLQLFNLEVERWGPLRRPGPRLRTPPLSDAQRLTLLSAMARAGAGEADREGVHHGPGLDLALSWRVGEEVVEGCEVWLHDPGERAFSALHRLLEATELCAFPPLLTASAARAEAMENPWLPPRLVQEPAELAEALLFRSRRPEAR